MIFISLFYLFLGVNDISFLNTTDIPPSPGIKLSVANIIVHPSYDENTFIGDICIMTLTTIIQYNNFINVACLPQYGTSFPSINQKAYTGGWGVL